MGEVDYTGFVNGINSNATQGLASLLQSIQYRQQMARQKEQDAMAAKLSNLQVAKLEDEYNYQKGLQAAMENPNIVTARQGEVKTQPTLASVLPAVPEYSPPPTAQEGPVMLASNDPSPDMVSKALNSQRPSLQQLGAASFEQPKPEYSGPLQPGMTVETKQQPPAEVGAEFALKHGRLEDASKYINLSEAMAKQSAIAKAYGSTEKAAQIDVTAEKMKKASTLLSDWKKAGGVHFAVAQAKQHPDLFGNVDLTKLSSTPNGINTYPVEQNGVKGIVYWHDDKPDAIHFAADLNAKDTPDKWQITEIPSPDGKTAQKYRVNAVTGDQQPVGKPYAVKSQVPNVNVHTTNGTTGSDVQIAAWADKIAKGEATLSEIPGRGPIRSQVVVYLKQNYPEVDLAKAGAQKKWTQDRGNMQTLALVDATKGVIADMKKQYAKLGRTDAPLVNAIQDKYQEVTGNADRTNYLTTKNYAVQEVERMLTGSGQMSDHRVKLAFETLKNSNTPGQMEAAISGIQKVMDERERATRQGPFQSQPAQNPAVQPAKKRSLPKF